MLHQKIIVPPKQIPADALRVKVLHVGDGDGFRADVHVGNGRQIRAHVRFGFIDAPEMSQRGGPEARNYLHGLIQGKDIDLAVTNRTETGDFIDKYGRIVGVPFLAEASKSSLAQVSRPGRPVFGQRSALVRNVELEMILNGWAWVLTRYEPGPEYMLAQRDAREHKRGIWAYDNNLAPWEYKKQVHRGKQLDEKFLTKHVAPKVVRANGNCPDTCCDGVLQQRVGKRGRFLGCSNYPRCKVTRNQ